MKQKIALAIHGGAGTILRAEMTKEKENDYTKALHEVLEQGWRVLQKSGSALDAVETAVRALEDCPLFNAGKGAVFTNEGKNEMDAAIMNGANLSAGSVSGVTNIKNPVSLARLVMEKTNFVLLTAEGALKFAKQAGIEIMPDEYFFTDHRYQQLLEARQTDKVQLDHAVKSDAETRRHGDTAKILNSVLNENPESQIPNPKSKIGTVGAVACDVFGNVAAATSTGGMTNKKFGRVGDSPIIGAGTYADNQTCAVSCTGHGEFFMRAVAAYDVACLMKYKGLSLAEASRETVEKLRESGGEGGLIAVDKEGNIALPFNSDGMYRGWITNEGEFNIKIYED